MNTKKPVDQLTAMYGRTKDDQLTPTPITEDEAVEVMKEITSNKFFLLERGGKQYQVPSYFIFEQMVTEQKKTKQDVKKLIGENQMFRKFINQLLKKVTSLEEQLDGKMDIFND